MRLEIADSDVLLLVDMQNDFCPGGKLEVPQGDEVVALVNLPGERFQHVGADAGLAPERSFAREGRYCPERTAVSKLHGSSVAPPSYPIVIWPA